MLTDAAIFLAAAVLVVPFFKRFGLGTVLGYLAAGALIGPYCFGLIGQVEKTLHFAEFGVVMLLFLIGLELQPSRLWKLRGAVFGAGGLQVIVTTIAIGVAATMLGVSKEASLTIGLALSMSSTAFALQVLAEKRELGLAHGRAAFGILLFQDLAAIPILALVPLLGVSESTSGMSSLQRVGVILGVIVGIAVAGRYLLRPLLRFIASARDHDLSAAATLLVVVGTALLMNAVGLSMALGTFLAGVLLSESEYKHELEANVEPYKGILLGLFFMAIGGSANLKLIVEMPAAILGLVLGATAVKLVVLALVGKFTKLGGRSAMSLGVALSQGGEFAFVIFQVALKGKIVSPRLADLLVVVVTLSMAMTPLLFVIRDLVLRRLEARGARPFDEIPDEGRAIIIAGFGRVGQIVGRVLHLKGFPFTAIDSNAKHIDFVRRYGNEVYYGDASRPELLRAAGADHARLFVLAIDDMEGSIATLKTVQHHFPGLKVVARARNRQHAMILLGMGVEVVVRENFLGSLEIAEKALEELGFESADARQAVQTFGEYDEARVKKQVPQRDDDEQTLIASAKEYTAELERIFMHDAREGAAAAGGADMPAGGLLPDAGVAPKKDA
jgi:monovalent cation:proton antiporter-2 (CPA2) family protein